MSGSHGSDEEGGSPPCLLHELDADGRSRADPQQARDVARWRKAERERLLTVRQALSAAYRAERTAAITAQLDGIVSSSAAAIVSVYWPIRAEPDLRAWMQAKVLAGLRIALPVALAVGEPLLFREWRPGAPMARGLWKIPYPAEGAELVPDVVLAPLVGFDRRSYRLGYGGGFFDRTLARMARPPLVIGVGYPESAIDSIFPQPHDIPMTRILTGCAGPSGPEGSAG